MECLCLFAHQALQLRIAKALATYIEKVDVLFFYPPRITKAFTCSHVLPKMTAFEYDVRTRTFR